MVGGGGCCGGGHNDDDDDDYIKIGAGIRKKIKEQHTDTPISVRNPTTVPRFLPASMTSSSLWFFCLVPAQMPTPSIAI